MALRSSKFAAATAVAAAFSLLATPVAAVELPRPAAVEVYDGDALNAERDRHRRWHRDHDDIDAGDVIAGVLVLGAIAAIAGARQGNRDRDRDCDYDAIATSIPRCRRATSATSTPGDARAATTARGIDRAVDMCVAEVERGAGRVGTVDSATRVGRRLARLGRARERRAVFVLDRQRRADRRCRRSARRRYGREPTASGATTSTTARATASSRTERAGDDGRYETAAGARLRAVSCARSWRSRE